MIKIIVVTAIIVILWVTAVTYPSQNIVNTVSKIGLKNIIERIWVGEK